MRFEEKLKSCAREDIWQEYCGFLDLSLADYMGIQRRLLLEQIALLGRCGLGKKFFKGKIPATVEEFRETVPFTNFHDYADILLGGRDDMLPAPPVIWLKTTWEGGDYPAKTAPYSAGMLEVYKRNILAAMLLSTSDRRGHFNVRSGSKVLYSLAPLPYATGLFPDLIDQEIKLHFMPSLREARKMPFSQQSAKGFQQSLRYGMNMFFGMSSIIYRISKNLEALSSSGSGKSIKALLSMSPRMVVRFLSAMYRSKRDGVPIRPADLYRLDGLVCVGTDSSLYKDELEELWGRRPLEIAGGTEPSCLGTETWSKNGLVFFPDACFYEFIPEGEMRRSLEDPGYQPQTYLMDELIPQSCYELVITVLKGGVFTRYRVGDVYRCLRLRNPQDGVELPQFEYIDRVPNVIDIAGFTRITEHEITRVVEMSGLPIRSWFALKEYDAQNHAYMHFYAEMDTDVQRSAAVDRTLLRELIGAHFRYYDGDYQKLKELLGADPLEITLLPAGTIFNYRRRYGRSFPKINPNRQDILDLLRPISGGARREEADGAC